MNRDRLWGATALLVTSALWGSSFPVIKIVVIGYNSLNYTWFRSLLSVIVLLPYILNVRMKGKVSYRVIKGGIYAGIAYSLGLWLQGWGTGLIEASSSAFITGVYVVFVHLFESLSQRKYSLELGISLVLSITGLYLLTMPKGEFRFGYILVLMGSLFWAAQLILVDRYGGEDPLAFTFYEFVPSILFFLPSYTFSVLSFPSGRIFWGLVYLSVFCNIIAFSLQAFGQRYVSSFFASIVLLMEPVFASFFSYIILGEKLMGLQFLGAFLTLASIMLAGRAD